MVEMGVRKKESTNSDRVINRNVLIGAVKRQLIDPCTFSTGSGQLPKYGRRRTEVAKGISDAQIQVWMVTKLTEWWQTTLSLREQGSRPASPLLLSLRKNASQQASLVVYTTLISEIRILATSTLETLGGMYLERLRTTPPPIPAILQISKRHSIERRRFNLCVCEGSHHIAWPASSSA